jgi:hypothetical protein
MSLAEIKEQVRSLSPEELAELAACVRLAQSVRDPGWLEGAARVREEMESGRRHSKAEFEELHRKLSAEGQ